MAWRKWSAAKALTDAECCAVRSDRVVRESLALLVMHRVEGLSQAQVAKGMNASGSKLRRHFESFGRSYRDVAEALRLELVAARLAVTHEKVDALAREHGFSGGDSLDHIFPRLYGMTPSAWRDSWAKAPPRVRGNVNELRDSINRLIEHIGDDR